MSFGLKGLALASAFGVALVISGCNPEEAPPVSPPGAGADALPGDVTPETPPAVDGDAAPADVDAAPAEAAPAEAPADATKAD